MQLTQALSISIRKDSIYFFDKTPLIQLQLLKIPNKHLDNIAAMDGIEPATGEKLIRCLHAMHGKGTLHGKILRWDSAPIKEERIIAAIMNASPVVEQVYATIKENAPLTSPGQNFIQIGFCKEVR